MREPNPPANIPTSRPWYQRVGPGLITACVVIGPGSILTSSKVGAEHGLLVCWSGFRTAVERERAVRFFSIRLWDQGDLLDQVFEHYEQLDVTMRSKIPLKRVWTLATAGDED